MPATGTTGWVMTARFDLQSVLWCDILIKSSVFPMILSTPFPHSESSTLFRLVVLHDPHPTSALALAATLVDRAHMLIVRLHTGRLIQVSLTQSGRSITLPQEMIDRIPAPGSALVVGEMNQAEMDRLVPGLHEIHSFCDIAPGGEC